VNFFNTVSNFINSYYDNPADYQATLKYYDNIQSIPNLIQLGQETAEVLGLKIVSVTNTCFIFQEAYDAEEDISIQIDISIVGLNYEFKLFIYTYIESDED